MIGAIIGAAASLIGGAANRRQRNKELAMQDPSHIRASAEAAGFNPLLFTNQAFQGLSYAPRFGDSIASAGELLARGLDDSAQQRAQISQLEQQNAKLAENAQRLVQGVQPRSVFDGRTTPAPRPSSAVPQIGGGSASGAASSRTGEVSFGAPDNGLDAFGVERPPTGGGDWNTDINPDDNREHVGPLVQTFTMPDGSVNRYPVGPDLDELIAGAGMLVAHNFRQTVENAPRLREQRRVLVRPQIEYQESREQARRENARWFNAPFRRTLTPSFN